MKQPTLSTFTGKEVNLLYPKLSTIDIADICHSLSLLCRYVGQTKKMLSVGKHSLLVSMLLPKKLKYDGLGHDFTEAYYGDWLGQLKVFPEYKPFRILENRMAELLSKKFKFRYPEHPKVKEIDKLVVKYEMAIFLNRKNVVVPKKVREFLETDHTPEEIEKLLLTEFKNLKPKPKKK